MVLMSGKSRVDPQRAGVLLASAVLMLLALVAAADARKVALVIGNDAYTNLPVLQKAVNDGTTMAQTLRAIGYEVLEGSDLTRRETSRLFSDLENLVEVGDEVFFYFAGHGVAIGSENYLIPTDMPRPRAGEEGLVRDEGHSVTDLVQRLQRRGAKTTILVLDACRNNPFEASGVRSIGRSAGLAETRAASGVFLLYSAGYGQAALDRLSDDDADPNSVFTRSLVPLLKTPGLSHVDVAKRVQQDVSRLARSVSHQQQPAYYDQILGEIVFRPADATPVTIPVATPDPTPVATAGTAPRAQPATALPQTPAPSADPAASQAWGTISQSENPAVIRMFINQFGKGPFGDIARARLRQLEGGAEDRATVGAADAAPTAPPTTAPTSGPTPAEATPPSQVAAADCTSGLRASIGSAPCPEDDAPAGTSDASSSGGAAGSAGSGLPTTISPGTAAPTVNPLEAQAREFWPMVANTDSPAMLRAFIEQFPGTVYAAFAEARLRDLEAAASQTRTPTVEPTPPQVASLPTDYLAVYRNIDFYGGDMERVIAFDATACGQLCADRASCQAFTYVDSGNQCILKGGREFATTYDGATSGLFFRSAGGGADAPSVRISWEVYTGRDFPGSDIAEMRTAGFDGCLRACAARGDCRGFAWAPKIKANNNCWLKSRAGSPVASSVAVRANIHAGKKVDYTVSPAGITASN